MPPRPGVIALGVILLWGVLVLVLAEAARHVFQMTAGEAWAYAIGMVSYVYLFTGLVIGLVYTVTHER